MLNIVVASTNPVKIRAAENGFRRVFPSVEINAIGISAPSEVAHQPRSDEETLRGALNRAQNVMARQPNADYWLGIEGGVQDAGAEMLALAWIVIRTRTRISKARTASFVLPPAVADLVRHGVELGEADDRVFNRTNSKQEDGAVGLLTNNVIDRAALYEPAVILALIPFTNDALYQP
ncbi:MAG: inosine/xanthosine triphosphatase [Anaerolineae bacterium]